MTDTKRKPNRNRKPRTIGTNVGQMIREAQQAERETRPAPSAQRRNVAAMHAIARKGK